VFLDPDQWPSLDAEIARYELHENRSGDADYENFLSRLAAPIIARTSVGSRGLDYGSGESDALAGLLTRSGRPTVAYDPAFRPDTAALDERYDFVVCSEVMEHVHEPRALFERFDRLVRPGGIVGIMTGMYDEVPSLADWWYIRDITHVCFYSKATMEWVARTFGWRAEFPAPNVTVFISATERDRSSA
jgi:SAM-dependent methyltransferase